MNVNDIFYKNISVIHDALLSKKLINYLPTIVPIPRSLLVTNVPMILVKNSGALVPKIVKYLLHKTILTL